MQYFIRIFLFLISSFLLSCSYAHEVVFLSKDVQLEKITQNIWRHITFDQVGEELRYPTNGLVILDKKNAMLIDTGWNIKQTNLILNCIENKQHKKVVMGIVTHWHEDRMGGIEALNLRHIPTLSSEFTAELAKKHHKPIATQQFKNKQIIQFGHEQIIAEYMGPGHTQDNIIVWIPKQHILFGGCLVKSLQATTLGNIQDANLKEWPHTIKRIQAHFPNVETVIPGHDNYGNSELLNYTVSMLDAKN